MHRYQPRIHLILRPDASSANAAVTDLESEKLRTFVFPESIFTAVTAYQNQLVSHLSHTPPTSSRVTCKHITSQSLRFNFTPGFTRSLIFLFATSTAFTTHKPDRFLPCLPFYSREQITKLKIDSNPFAKGFRDSSRLTDLERETVESMMKGAYPHPSSLPPFFFNPNDPASLLLARERASLFGISGGPPVSHPSAAAAAVAAMTKTSAGSLWRPPMNPNQMYNFLAASAACAPWYMVAALAAESSGQRMSAGQMPQSGPPATSTASPYLWPSHPGSGLPPGLSFSDLMKQSIGSSSPHQSHHFPLRPEAQRDSSSPQSHMRYTPFSSHPKDGSEASASPLELTTTGTSLHSSLEK